MSKSDQEMARQEFLNQLWSWMEVPTDDDGDYKLGDVPLFVIEVSQQLDKLIDNILTASEAARAAAEAEVEALKRDIAQHVEISSQEATRATAAETEVGRLRKAIERHVAKWPGNEKVADLVAALTQPSSQEDAGHGCPDCGASVPELCEREPHCNRVAPRC
jgi:hypothetical protein